MRTQTKKKETPVKNSSVKRSSSGTSKSTKNKKQESKITENEKEKRDKGVIDNVWGIIFIVLGIFLFAAVRFNAAGELGNIIGNFLKGTFGFVGLILPFYLIVFGILLLLGHTISISWFSILLGSIMLLMICLLNSGRFISPDNIYFDLKEFYAQGITLEGGGFFGMLFSMVIVKFLGKVGLYGIAAAGILVCLLLLINTPVSRGIEALRVKRKERLEKKEEARLAEMEAHEKSEQLNVNIVPKHESKEKPSFFKRKETPEDRKKAIVNLMNEPDNFDKTIQGEPVDEAGIITERQVGIEPQRIVRKGFGLDDYDDGLFGDTDYKEKESFPKIVTPLSNIPEKRSVEATILLEGKKKEEVKTNETKSSVSVSSYNPDQGDSGVSSHDNVEKITNSDARNAKLDKKDFAKVRRTAKYKKPPIYLLKNIARSDDGKNLNAELQQRAQVLEDTLRNFNVDAKVVQVTQGPAVTRYEIQPAVGVKVSKITGLADDIALNLRAKSIRIEAPIPGKAAVGIEVENEKINMVTLREIIESREFKQSKSKITFAVGRDIAGNAIVADLTTMPHLLIAGSTGSGKSVCINSIITSILYKADPDDVRLILIDPKVVELGEYAHIPHLLIPVVTDATKAAAALNWGVSEMSDRYNKFAAAKVKDLEGYNEYVETELQKMKYQEEDYDSRSDGETKEQLQPLPRIVIIIDELADLMMAAPSQVEESIARLTQLARAAGIHLIVATQRPSVDVVTGLIKSNIPSRIAFAVPSQHDSRTILDKVGAEKLVGKGDMLYHPLGDKSMRVQGCFISPEETQDVINFVESQTIEPEYNLSAQTVIERGNIASGSDPGQEEEDELFDDAVAFVVAEGKASTSLIQRRFRIGYNRAARIIDLMEERGIVGPPDGSKPRQVLLTQERYDAEHGISAY